MADYHLTQTGAEVQDILDSALKVTGDGATLTQTGDEVQAILDNSVPIKGTSKMVFGTYFYSGSNTTSISFTDANVSGCNFIIASCQDAGNPITSASINGTNITVYFTTALSLCRLNYIAFV